LVSDPETAFGGKGRGYEWMVGYSSLTSRAGNVRAREVAVLESAGDFKSALTYLPNTAADDFVSLTMPVRTEPWVWDDQLPPIFQMNLPEG
jgi:hypothetical protein